MQAIVDRCQDGSSQPFLLCLLTVGCHCVYVLSVCVKCVLLVICQYG